MRLRARSLALALVVGVAACGAAPALAAHDSAASTSSTSLDDRGGGGGEAKAKAQASGDPPCLAIDYSNIGQLREPCEDPALACDDANGCVGAMVRWLSPQFENREIDASAYANVTSEWMVGCVAPHVEDYMTNIPVPTFVGLQQCEFDGYFDAYPELRAFDFSSVDSMDFIRAMPPGMLMRIMSGTVDARS